MTIDVRKRLSFYSMLPILLILVSSCLTAVTPGDKEAIPQSVELRPLSPDTLDGLRSYSRRYRVKIDGKQGIVTLPYDVLKEGIIHYDRREGMQRLEENGRRWLSRSPGHTRVLLPGQSADRTFLVNDEYPDVCRTVEWVFQPSRFEEVFGSVDILEDLRNLHITNDERQIAVTLIGEETINGIPSHHYQVDPTRATDILRQHYADFNGTLSGDVYVAGEGEYVVKYDLQLRGPSIPWVKPGMMDGVIYLQYEVNHLNDAPPVVLPAVCEDHR
jgi:hypothetical protein